ncbi:sensor histidine kinase [Streptomyces sp. ODS05-4]|uniref:sensor histidine kinase n=1 Tax=Streptomyces sp. ODS05-4 TaxID=2944939 RepID=UPI0027E460EE|nr:sensor histidine kinase [Streptomyces sp. ODS05-4]
MLAVTEVLDQDAGQLSPDSVAAVQLISAETSQLAVLIENLMEMSRFDAQAAELRTDEVDAADNIRKTLAARHWTDPREVTAELGDAIRARLEPRRFDVVVANLVGNALRHGRPPVVLKLTPLTRGGLDWFSLTVTDHGPGNSPEALPHVFERFYKADVARTRSAGSGLGLAIARENTRLHGGDLRAENAPGAVPSSS